MGSRKSRTVRSPSLREDTEKLRAVVSALPDLLFVLDEDGRYVEALSSSESLFYREARKLVGHLMKDVLPPDKARLFHRTVLKTLRTGKSQVLEYQLQVPAGCVEFEGRTAPLKGRINGRRAVVWVSRDVTDRVVLDRRLRNEISKTREAYRKLKRTQALLVRSEKIASVGMVIAGMTHELNNPLNVLYGNLKLLQQTAQFKAEPGGEAAKPPQKAAGMLSAAVQGAERIKAIMEKFRSFSRIDRPIDRIQLNDSLKAIARTWRKGGGKGIRIMERLRPLEPIQCDAGQIEQLFSNLVGNAVEAMNGRGVVTITSRPRGDRIVVEVGDSGPGIPPHLQKRIFEPFFTSKPLGKGMGLGLPISSMIVEAHGGTLSVRNSADKGATFRVELPAG